MDRTQRRAFDPADRGAEQCSRRHRALERRRAPEWPHIGTPRRRSAYEACFREVEQILLGHDGRPHWGGIHFRSAADLAAAYPRWDSFQAVRARMDPTGVFENAYTRRCLGPVT
ncbi:MAG: hypothetical protein M5U19_20165 [Microthrixaceae bacterium]|nr:hypothetical protein [Microthrixaceae bacterium]